MSWRLTWMLLGFAAALTGDWFLVVKASPSQSPGFLAGVIGFACAHLCWMIGQCREAKPKVQAFVALAIPLGAFSLVRLGPLFPPVTAGALCIYSLLTSLGMAMALATRRRWYIAGIWLLALSDIFIGESKLGAPGCGALIRPVYLAAEACLVISCCLKEKHRIDWHSGDAHALALIGCLTSFFCFQLAMAVYPCGGYNTATQQMLSVLGRVVNQGTSWPGSHFAFTAGIIAAAACCTRAIPLLLADLPTSWRMQAYSWGMAVNAGGLLLLAAIPEDTNIFFHNAGYWLAGIGGASAMIALDGKGWRRVFTFILGCTALLFCIAKALQGMQILSPSPWMVALQKLLVFAFMAWILAVTSYHAGETHKP